MCRLKFTKILAILSMFVVISFSQTLNFATSKNVGPLNPHLYGANEMFAQNMVYEALVKYGEDGKFEPWLANSWKISDDGKIYTFYLRKDVVFSNGEKFDANAVKANFDAIFANRNRHNWMEFVQIFEKCVVVDDYTVEISIKNPYSQTLHELSLIRPFRFVAPSAMIDKGTKDGLKAPIGTGVWKLVDSKLGVYDKFELNEKYYGKKPNYTHIMAKVIPDPNTKVIALRSGEIDLVYGSGEIPLESFMEFSKDKNFKTTISKPLMTLAIAMNSAKFPTSDAAVRKALNMAVDKDLMMKKVFFNTQQKADFLFSPTNEISKIDAKPYEFSAKKAKEILQKAGWMMKNGVFYKDNKPLKITLSYLGNDAAQKAIGEILQSEFSKIGAILELNACENTMFYKRQKMGEFDLIYNSTWGAPYDPESFVASMRAPSHADYMAQRGMKDKKAFDAKITKMLATVDNKAKSKLVKELLSALHEEAIYLPITNAVNMGVGNKNVQNIQTSIIQANIPFEKINLNK